MSQSSATRPSYFNQAGFNSWSARTKPSTRALTAAIMALTAVSTLFAIAVMGPRLVREGALLWFGNETGGIIRKSEIVKIGAFKGGDPKYRLTLDYTFKASGTEVSGQTVRSDIRTPPTFAPGDAIGVFYEEANPRNSVADHNLRIDVYALLFFLPFLAVVGLGMPLWYFLSWRAWRTRGG